MLCYYKKGNKYTLLFYSDQNRIECLAMEFCFYMNTRINKIPKLKKNEPKSQDWYKNQALACVRPALSLTHTAVYFTTIENEFNITN